MATIRNVEVGYNGNLCYELVDDADWRDETDQLYYADDPRAALYDTQNAFLDALYSLHLAFDQLAKERTLRERTQDAFMDEVERV